MRTLAGAAAAIVLLLVAPAALAHQGNPHFRSEVQRIAPPVKGVTVSVLNYDDRLLLRNASGRDVVIDDYEDKPYARVLADRTVEVNTNSAAYYLNDDRYANVTVPKGLSATPHWKLVDRTGRFQWHDHRMHWMSTSIPAQVKDTNRRTHIFNWQIPISVGGQKAAIAGSLTWVPLDSGGSLPMGAIWALAAVIIAGSIVVLVVRRRRAGDPAAEAEAW